MFFKYREDIDIFFRYVNDLEWYLIIGIDCLLKTFIGFENQSNWRKASMVDSGNVGVKAKTGSNHGHTKAESSSFSLVCVAETGSHHSP